MFPRHMRLSAILKVLFCFFFLFLFSFSSRAVIRDGGIDNMNPGRGTWIYILPNAINQLGGNVSSVSNLTSLMIYMKNQGLQYVILKAAQGDTVFNQNGSPQFTPAVVQAGHAAGLKVYGYIYTTGANVPGEISMCNFIFNQGADGLIYDAEGEWESTTAGSQVGANGPALATQLCSNVRSNWPNKFIGLSTWPYRGVHSTLPYKEFAYYCDVIMPQAYWIELSDTPTECVARINSDWLNWKNTLTGKWTNSIKPFLMTGQGWNFTNAASTALQISEFERCLRTNTSSLSPGGFKGVDYWRAELHSSAMWSAIRTNFFSKPYTNAPVVEYVPVANVGATTADISWPTDQISDGVVEYGTSTGYGSLKTNAASIWYHTVNLTGLSPNTTYHYRVKSKGTNNLTGVSADYVFTTVSVAVADIIIDQDSANNSGGNTIAYTGSWSTPTSGSAYLGTFRYASGTFTLGSPTATAKFIPNIVTPGNYNVYASWAASSPGGNRATNSPIRINNNGTVTTVRVNQEANGNSFQLVASNKFFQAGTIDYVSAENDVTASLGGDIVIADAVKLVFIPPPPSAPSISTPPAAQTVTQGNEANFFVVASGTAPLTFQWKFKGTNILNATNSTYTKNNVQAADAGNYSVSITNSVGGINSANAFLTVNQYPTITAPPLDAIRDAGSNVTFSVRATGTAPLFYQWKFNDEIIPNANSTNYTRSNLQTNDSGTYSVLVTNVAGSTSASATLTVNPQLPAPFEINSITLMSPGAVRLELSGEARIYSVDGTSDFPNWTEITNFANTNGVFQFVDPVTNSAYRFYRLRTAP